HTLHEITRVAQSYSICIIPNTLPRSQDLIERIFPNSSFHDQLQSINSEISN
ncbi:12597_t:CDS:1, partial [Funneliformis geosporum]